MNLLRPRKEFPTGDEFNETFIKQNGNKYELKNKDVLLDMLKGYISYYGGAPEIAFPQRLQRVVRCPMSKYQYNSYKIVERREGGFKKANILKLPNNFLIGTRILSNIAFPNKLANERGFKALTRHHMIPPNVSTYSSKMAMALSKIEGKGGTAFVYSGFKEFGGIRTFAKILEANGYKDFNTHGEGRKRYAIWSGDEPLGLKEKIRDVFNAKNNEDGHRIKIILGSPSIKEGVSLLRVRSVHVLEPYWNMSRIEQVVGRAIRFCSHKDVDPERRYVKVYLYIATSPSVAKRGGLQVSKPQPLRQATVDAKPQALRQATVDEHIYRTAMKKLKLTKEFEYAMKEAAVDRLLFQ